MKSILMHSEILSTDTVLSSLLQAGLLVMALPKARAHLHLLPAKHIKDLMNTPRSPPR